MSAAQDTHVLETQERTEVGSSGSLPTSPSRIPSRTSQRGQAGAARFARAALSNRIVAAALAILAVGSVWELYKALGPDQGWSLGETRILPRTTDIVMPHTWSMVERLFDPVSGASGAASLWWAVVVAAIFTLSIAIAGWLIGVLVGVILAVAMQRLKIVERAVLPLVIVSQTVPLIALAPLVRSWGSQISIGSITWAPWMSVAVIASYLAFFPVAVGTLRGLQSPSQIQVELLHAYGAGWWTTLVRLRVPAAIPQILPALRLAAANAVVGTVVAEVATGLPGGIGRMILEYANFAASDPAKPWAPIFGSVILGLLAAGAIGLLGASLKKYRRVEAR